MPENVGSREYGRSPQAGPKWLTEIGHKTDPVSVAGRQLVGGSTTSSNSSSTLFPHPLHLDNAVQLMNIFLNGKSRIAISRQALGFLKSCAAICIQFRFSKTSGNFQLERLRDGV